MTVAQTVKYLAIVGLSALVLIVFAFWFNVLVLGRLNVENDQCEATGVLSGLDPDCESLRPLPTDPEGE